MLVAHQAFVRTMGFQPTTGRSADRLLDTVFKKVQQMRRARLRNVKAISVGIDGWSNRFKSYIGGSASYIDQDFNLQYVDVLVCDDVSVCINVRT